MANILALETSSPLLSLAIKKGSAKTREICVEGFLSHAENLLPGLDTLLKKEKLGIDDIDTLLIGRGPGSFTGLRVGFASLKGLLAVRKRACLGAISLDLIAAGIDLPEGAELVVCLDARRERIFVKRYRRASVSWVSVTETEALSLEELLLNLPSQCYLTGDALEKYGTSIKEQAGDKIVRFFEENTWYPKASSLITLFHQPWRDEAISPLSPLKTPTDFLPLYFRLSEAEERKKDSAHSR